jgi:hypothetical protein
MQAGREIRVMVKPDRIDDIQAQVIARDIAKQVEEELTYPGQIRVTVVRESRATEFARLVADHPFRPNGPWFPRSRAPSRPPPPRLDPRAHILVR